MSEELESVEQELEELSAPDGEPAVPVEEEKPKPKRRSRSKKVTLAVKGSAYTWDGTKYLDGQTFEVTREEADEILQREADRGTTFVRKV